MAYQNINQYNYPKLKLQIVYDGQDMSLASDERSFNEEVVFSPYLIAQTYGTKLPVYFDIDNPLTWVPKTLNYKNYDLSNIFVSQNYYFIENPNLDCYNPQEVCDIGLTGIDNGLVDKMTGKKITFTNGLFDDSLKFDRYHFDKRLKLFQVTGYTGAYNRFSAITKQTLYEVVSKNNIAVGKYHELYGGFYQGFYKLFGYDYDILPNRMNKGWTVEMLLKPRLINEFTPGPDETTLNQIYPKNKNMFFYWGTRAENKFYHYANGSPWNYSGYTRVTTPLYNCIQTCACCTTGVTNSRCIYVYPPRSINNTHDPHVNYGCNVCNGNPTPNCGCSCGELPCQECGWECQTHSCIPTQGIPGCTNRILVIQVCNSNSAKDDNFDVYLNNVLIGSLDLNQDAQIGSVFIGINNSGYTVTQPDFVCPLSGMTNYWFDASSVVNTGSNTIFMKNTQNNNNGNYGQIQIRNYLIDGQDLIDPCFVANLEYSGPSGDDFTIDFNYEFCCAKSGDTNSTNYNINQPIQLPSNYSENVLTSLGLTGNFVGMPAITGSDPSEGPQTIIWSSGITLTATGSIIPTPECSFESSELHFTYFSANPITVFTECTKDLNISSCSNFRGEAFSMTDCGLGRAISAETEYNLHFSQPVNDIILMYYAVTVTTVNEVYDKCLCPYPPKPFIVSEYLKLEVDTGTNIPSLTPIDVCCTLPLTSNIIEADNDGTFCLTVTAPGGDLTHRNATGVVLVSNSEPFTTLTFKSIVNLTAGMTLAIYGGETPIPPPVSPTPTPTPTPTPSPEPIPFVCPPDKPSPTCSPQANKCNSCGSTMYDNCDGGTCSSCGCGCNTSVQNLLSSIEDTCEKDPKYDTISNNISFKLGGDPKNPSICVKVLKITGACEVSGTCITGLTYETGCTITEICTPPIYPYCLKDNPLWLELEHWFQIDAVWERYTYIETCDLFYYGGLGLITKELDLQSLANNTSALIAPPYSNNKSVSEKITLIQMNNLWLEQEKFRRGRLKIYINGKIFFKIENFEEIIPRGLNTDKEKQLGVPFNISWGGGTQGLREHLTFSACTDLLDNYIQDPECFPTNVLNQSSLFGMSTSILLEQNFGGTFEGGISQFRLYVEPLGADEVKHNFKLLKDKFLMFDPDCPVCETEFCLPNDFEYEVVTK